MILRNTKLALGLLLIIGGGNARAEGVGGILGGVAQIIQAVSPIVVAGIQAKADVKIAKINADAAIKTTEITAETSKDLAVMQKEVAIYQAETSAEINKQNNDATTERLGMQLAELRAAREDARDSEREKRRIEQQYNDMRIELAKKQADDQIKLAKLTLQAQLVQAGLTSGFKTMDSSKGMTTRNLMRPGGTAPMAAVRYDQRAMTVMRGSNGYRFSGTSGGRSISSQRLLAALTGSRVESERGIRRPSSMETLLTGNLISGSTTASRFRAVAKPESDLTAFRRAPVLADAQDYVPRSSEPLTQAGGHSGGSSRGFMGDRFRAVSP